ncbi:hypothetical protein T12_1371 [Trichinella patagoniensis]|uniref:Transmembrane protein n=1 Tax=Trichinella patagoniensis TaxID=990121 RepID=A0A0V1A505_9BILA|nr:hypothetical protein T12_1371 [Trichinella patagoniensis]
MNTSEQCAEHTVTCSKIRGTSTSTMLQFIDKAIMLQQTSKFICLATAVYQMVIYGATFCLTVWLLLKFTELPIVPFYIAVFLYLAIFALSLMLALCTNTKLVDIMSYAWVLFLLSSVLPECGLNIWICILLTESDSTLGFSLLIFYLLRSVGNIICILLMCIGKKLNRIPSQKRKIYNSQLYSISDGYLLPFENSIYSSSSEDRISTMAETDQSDTSTAIGQAVKLLSFKPLTNELEKNPKCEEICHGFSTFKNKDDHHCVKSAHTAPQQKQQHELQLVANSFIENVQQHIKPTENNCHTNDKNQNCHPLSKDNPIIVKRRYVPETRAKTLPTIKEARRLKASLSFNKETQRVFSHMSLQEAGFTGCEFCSKTYRKWTENAQPNSQQSFLSFTYLDPFAYDYYDSVEPWLDQFPRILSVDLRCLFNFSGGRTVVLADEVLSAISGNPLLPGKVKF